MRLLATLTLIMFLSSNLFANSPEVFFVSPEDGAELSSPVKIQMGVKGYEVAKAGDLTPKTGHHHLIINGAAIKKGEVVPADTKHIHYGVGQTASEVILEPGKYELTLQFADGMHRSYGEEMSSSIHITVK